MKLKPELSDDRTHKDKDCDGGGDSPPAARPDVGVAGHCRAVAHYDSRLPRRVGGGAALRDFPSGWAGAVRAWPTRRIADVRWVGVVFPMRAGGMFLEQQKKEKDKDDETHMFNVRPRRVLRRPAAMRRIVLGKRVLEVRPVRLRVPRRRRLAER